MNMVNSDEVPQLIIGEVTDEREIARHNAQDKRHARNLNWLQTHWSDLPAARGRYVAVANQQAFVAETAAAAWNWARLQTPSDDGAVVMHVPAEQSWRIWT